MIKLSFPHALRIFIFHLFAHLHRLLAFIVNPAKLNYRRLPTSKKLKDVVLGLSIIDIVITSVIIALLSILDYFHLFDGIEDKEFFKNNKSVEIVGLIIFAPLFEEAVFRFPLRFFVYVSYFKWVIYAFCLLFAVSHLTNYQFSNISWVILSLLVIPQLWAGFLLSYTRLKYGIWYAVLLHFLHNLWAFLLHLFD